jgi:fatty-acyl-CoA synthase
VTRHPLLDEAIGVAFARVAAARAGREALVEVATGRRWTWGELDAAASTWPAS